MNRMDVPMDSPLGKLLMQKIAAKEEADFEKLPKIAVENRARVLLDALEDWGKPCPFVRGNLVAPKDDREFPGGGVWRPEALGIVVRVLDAPYVGDIDDTGGTGIDADMMILLAGPTDGSLSEKFAHSRNFKLYTGPVAD